MTENVALPLRARGLPGGSPTGAPGRDLDQLGLTDEGQRPHPTPHSASSSGWALGSRRGIEPIVLLADEPTSHQDAGHIATVLGLLGRWSTAAPAWWWQPTTPPRRKSPIGCSTSIVDLRPIPRCVQPISSQRTGRPLAVRLPRRQTDHQWGPARRLPLRATRHRWRRSRRTIPLLDVAGDVAIEEEVRNRLADRAGRGPADAGVVQRVLRQPQGHRIRTPRLAGRSRTPPGGCCRSW